MSKKEKYLATDSTDKNTNLSVFYLLHLSKSVVKNIGG